jgi:hypothetical protein
MWGLHLCFPSEWRCTADFYHHYKCIALTRFEPVSFGSSDKHTNHYTTEATSGTLHTVLWPCFQSAVTVVWIIDVLQLAMYPSLTKVGYMASCNMSAIHMIVTADWRQGHSSVCNVCNVPDHCQFILHLKAPVEEHVKVHFYPFLFLLPYGALKCVLFYSTDRIWQNELGLKI